MWRGLIFALALTGCASLQTQFEDIQARQLDLPAGKAAIYVIREAEDHSAHPTVVMLDGRSESLTYPGTFVRWDVAPGPHRVTGFGSDAGKLEFNAMPGKFYFIRQTVSLVEHMPLSRFDAVNKDEVWPSIERGKWIAAS